MLIARAARELAETIAAIGFTPQSRTHSQVAVLGYSYWTCRFSRNPSVIGQTFFVKGIGFTIIGAGPERFFGLEPAASTDLWIPLQNRCKRWVSNNTRPCIWSSAPSPASVRLIRGIFLRLTRNS